MAFKTSVPISTVAPVSGSILDRFLVGVKNIPTHLHIGLFGSKMSRLPTKTTNNLFPTKGINNSGR